SLPNMSYDRIVLYGSSYGSVVATMAAGKMARDVGSLILTSNFRSENELISHPRPSIRTTIFQGENDPICDARCAAKVMEEVFGRQRRNGFPFLQTFPAEGHLFAHRRSLAVGG